MKVYLGQQVFLKPVGNAARYGNNDVKEEVILKVGRKYFFVGKAEETNERFMTKFNIEGLSEASDYSANWRLYFSKQEILDEKESNKLIAEIKTVFERYNNVELTLDQLRRVKEIITE